MATELAAAYVTIIPSLKGAQRTIQNELNGINVSGTSKTWGSSIVGSVGGAFNKVAGIGIKAMAGISAAVSGFTVGGGISRALKLDQAQMMFENMGIDVESAMKSCNEAVIGTAYGLDAAAQTAAMLGASGIKAGEEMTNALKGVAGMAAMSGNSMEHIGSIFGKVAAQGRLQGDELTQFAENGINATAALAKHLGITQSEVRELVSKGQIDFKTFSDAMYESFGEAAQGANETFQGAMANVGASLSRIGAKFASPALEGIRKVFVALIPAINSVSKLLDPLVEKFTKFVDVVSGKAVSSVETFTKVLNDTGRISSALKITLGNIVGNDVTQAFTAITKFVRDCYLAFNRAQTPMEGFKAVIDRIKNAINGLSSGNLFGSYIDAIKAKIATLPQPVQNVIGIIQGFAQKVIGALNGMGINGGIAIAGFTAILLKFHKPLTTVANGFVKFGTMAAGVFTKIGGLSGIFATIAMKINTFRSAITLCGGGLKGLSAIVSGGVRGAFMALRGVIMGIFSPATLIVGLIAAIVASFVAMMATNEEFRNTVGLLVASIGSSLSPVLETVGQTIQQLATNVLPVIMGVIHTLVPILAQVVVIVLQVFAAIAPLIAQLISALLPAIADIITIVANVLAAVMPAVTAILGVVMSVISAIIPAIGKVLKTVGSVVSGIISFIGMVISVVGNIVSVVVGVVSSVIDAVIGAVEDITGAVEDIIGYISEIPGKITGFFTDAGTWLLDAGKEIIDGLISGITEALGGLGDFLGGIGEFIVEHKGPPAYDAVMLKPAGELIIGSLVQGMERGIPMLRKSLGLVNDTISGYATEMQPFGDIDTNIRTWSKSEIVSSYEQNREQTSMFETALSELGNRIENLKIVMDSGELVGATASKYDRAQGRRQLLAERGF